jgi:solute carrier family 9B (sodium/hydrogen exchanger), member 1/2
VAFSIAEIIVLSIIADWLFRRLRVPGLIGILLVGILLGPRVLNQINPDLLAIGSDLRLIALIVILLRAGFELSRKTLHRVGGKALLLAFIPATCEGVVITLAGHRLLGLTLMEAALLGSILAAVSPAVVVPRMIDFIKERRGAKKAIPSMVMAAASVDDIYVIVVHSVLVGLYVGRRMNIAWEIAAIPLSLVLGAAAGLGIGWILYRIFERSDLWATKQVLIVIAASIFLVRLQHYLAGLVPFAGLVAAMAIGFIILERREHIAHAISARLARVWIFAEIVLFSMVGAQVNITVAWRAGLAGIAVILIGLLARSAGVMACLAGSGLTIKERAFVAVAYSPKATVQAAIGASPLLAMRAAGLATGPGEIILAVAVLSILLTAPAGAWAIGALGRRVLPVEPEAGENAYRAALESSD